jgi:hypothetical protein
MGIGSPLGGLRNFRACCQSTDAINQSLRPFSDFEYVVGVDGSGFPICRYQAQNPDCNLLRPCRSNRLPAFGDGQAMAKDYQIDTPATNALLHFRGILNANYFEPISFQEGPPRVEQPVIASKYKD